MKNFELRSLVVACLLLLLASCKTGPPPPEAMKLPADENSAKVYIRAENEYTGKWLNSYRDLEKTVGAELNDRQIFVPPSVSGENDTLFINGEKWKIVVRNGREVHLIGNIDKKAGDRIIYAEQDEAFRVSLRTSFSKVFLFIESVSEKSSETRYIRISSGAPVSLVMQERKPGVKYKAEHFGGNNIWILTNENAPMRSILIGSAQSPDPDYWKAAVRENDSVYIDDFTLINLQYLVLVQRKNLGTSIEITDLYPDKRSGIENKINFPEAEGKITGLTYEPGEDKIVFVYSSIITPPTCYTYGIHSMHMGIRWKKQFKSYIQDNYKAGGINAIGSSNTRIPVSYITKRDEESNARPKPLLLLIAAGAPSEQGNGFSPDFISLLDRGFTIACVHMPASQADLKEGTGKITAAVSALISKQITTTENIILYAKSGTAAQAIKATGLHPAWFRALILESPETSGISGLGDLPFTCVYADSKLLETGSAGIGMVSALRSIAKTGNTLLLISGNNIDKNETMRARLITFILATNGISK